MISVERGICCSYDTVPFSSYIIGKMTPLSLYWRKSDKEETYSGNILRVWKKPYRGYSSISGHMFPSQDGMKQMWRHFVIAHKYSMLVIGREQDWQSPSLPKCNHFYVTQLGSLASSCKHTSSRRSNVPRRHPAAPTGIAFYWFKETLTLRSSLYKTAPSSSVHYLPSLAKQV